MLRAFACRVWHGFFSIYTTGTLIAYSVNSESRERVKMGTWTGWPQEMVRALLDFAYPPQCAVCLADIEARMILCDSCWSEIEKIKDERLSPATSDIKYNYPIFNENIILGDFSGVLQEAIYALKFRNQPQLGQALGRHMALCLAERLAEIDYLLPVPLHPARLRERGYNQSAEIARGLAAVLGVPVCDGVLRRNKNTQQQALLPAGERSANLHGAFSQVGTLPVGVRIGVVDDVLTTGATLQAVAEALHTDCLSAIVLARPKQGEFGLNS